MLLARNQLFENGTLSTTTRFGNRLLRVVRGIVMAPDQVRSAIIEVASQIQSQSQRDVPPMDGGTRLIGDLPGFDSLNAVEFVVLLTDVLGDVMQGREIPDRMVLGGGKNARPSIDEISQRVAKFLAAPVAPKQAKGQAALPARNTKHIKEARDEQSEAPTE